MSRPYITPREAVLDERRFSRTLVDILDATTGQPVDSYPFFVIHIELSKAHPNTGWPGHVLIGHQLNPETGDESLHRRCLMKNEVIDWWLRLPGYGYYNVGHPTTAPLKSKWLSMASARQYQMGLHAGMVQTTPSNPMDLGRLVMGNVSHHQLMRALRHGYAHHPWNTVLNSTHNCTAISRSLGVHRYGEVRILVWHGIKTIGVLHDNQLIIPEELAQPALFTFYFKELPPDVPYHLRDTRTVCRLLASAYASASSAPRTENAQEPAPGGLQWFANEEFDVDGDNLE